MSADSFTTGEGKRLALEVLGRRRAEVIARISPEASPSSSFYSSIKQTRRRYLTTYLDWLSEAIANDDTTDFLGNETFQSYSQAKNGFMLKEVLQVPLAVKHALTGLLSEMVEKEDVDAAAALEAKSLLDDLLDQAGMIRAQSFIQTRDETIHFYQSCQEEIDRFPGNLAATLDYSTLMRSAVRKCVELVGVGRCAFFTRDLLTSELHLQASNFDHEKVFGDPLVKLDEQQVKQLVYKREPVLVEGYRRSLPLITGLMKRMKTKVVAIVPLLVRDRNVGVVLMDNVDRPQMFTPDAMDLAVRFANKVAVAMENARLHGSEQKKLKETMALLEVSRLVTSTLEIDTLFSRLVQITADVCEVGKCSVYLFMEEDDRFYPTATYGVFTDSDWETSMGEGISISDLLEEEVETLLERKQVVVSDVHLSPFIPADRIENTGIISLLLVPMFSRQKLLGIMVLFYRKESDELEGEDLSLVTAVASHAAVALENATLYENLEMSYFSTVKALARAIEVKDPYTHGHSERVTEYALAIARSMEVSDLERKNIKYAGALHDIGKIGISRRVLDKPGALSEEECMHVQTHPQLGDSIIEPVGFLQDPREIILHHHERYDGKGYPSGLKGEEVPLGARILAVADAFEAMMSDRPYRKALPLEEAVRELEINSGTQFDPRVVGAFLDVVRGRELRNGESTREEQLQVKGEQ